MTPKIILNIFLICLISFGGNILFAQTQSPITDISTPDSDVEIGSEFTLEATLSSQTLKIDAAEIFVDLKGEDGMGIDLPLNYGNVDSTLATLEYTTTIYGNRTFYIHAKDISGNWGVFDSVSVHILRQEKLKTAYCYPNPAPIIEDYGEKVHFAFYLSEAAIVTIEIYNAMGDMIETIGPFQKDIGRYDSGDNDPVWAWDISEVASDIYLYKIEAEWVGSGEKDFIIKKLAVVR
jgi:hypothetical protein